MVSRRDVLIMGGAMASAAGLGKVAATAPSPAADIADPELWINQEPSRWLWVLARMIDAGSDTRRFVDAAAAMHVNVLLMTVGGLVAFYPSQVEYHLPSSYMPPGRDYFGETAAYARARGMRVCGRLDYSRVIGQAYTDHPDWFFVRPDGKPVVDETGRYQPCINGPWYREHSLKITDEVMTRYELSGLFMNNFVNNPRSWGDQGLCHCANCQAKFKARTGRAIPDIPDPEYEAFIDASVSEASALHRRVVKQHQPQCIYMNDTEPTDGAHTESRMPFYPAALWPYGASASVNHMRNSDVRKAALNIVVSYSSNAQRLATMPSEQARHDLYQALAWGSVPVIAITGTGPQEDRSSLLGAAPVFAFAAANEELYVGQRSAARVLVLSEGYAHTNFGASDSLRGIVRILTEAHIPFSISDNGHGLEADPKAFDLVIAAPGSEVDLDAYIKAGGRAIYVQTPPVFALGQPLRRWSPRSSYFRIRDRKLFASVDYTNLVAVSGEFMQYPDDASAALTFVPPSLSEMAETAQSDLKESLTPGLILRAHGQGTLAYLPWDLPGVHYRQMFPAHAALFTDLVDHLAGTRQLTSSAHPHVEMVLMEQPARRRTLLHLINGTGQAQSGYAPPIPLRDIAIELAGIWQSAIARSTGNSLPLARGRNHTSVVLPQLDHYDVVVFS